MWGDAITVTLTYEQWTDLRCILDAAEGIWAGTAGDLHAEITRQVLDLPHPEKEEDWLSPDEEPAWPRPFDSH